MKRLIQLTVCDYGYLLSNKMNVRLVAAVLGLASLGFAFPAQAEGVAPVEGKCSPRICLVQ